MKKASMIIASILFFASLSIMSVSAEEKAADVTADDAFIIAKCAACHKIDKVCKKVGKKDAGQWEALVKSMVKRGAKLDDAEQKAAAEYLASLKADSNTLCPK
ncbi:hypothetical protein [Desulforegula conservatrix]|uniref:hypothetical protein n=1 Tax=Desulforegula conservatrix TaxID=153026 RepID=UPI000419D800|nr:hypothetical protein [Desulforegula conservatrix]